MENTKTTYYKDQLNKVKIDPIYAPTLKISSVTGQTKWMDLNKESATEIVKWLTANFINK